MNVPLWHFSITKKMSQAIEKVQKACVFIILGKHATHDYQCNLAILDLEPLSDRRNDLCKEFANKAFKHPVHGKMFKNNESSANTRGTRRRVIVPVGKSVRYNNSAVPSLARLLNSRATPCQFLLSPLCKCDCEQQATQYDTTPRPAPA